LRIQPLGVEHQPGVAPDMKLLVGSVMILSALVDLPRSLGIGSFSALGVFTAGFIVLSLVVWLSSGLIAPKVGLIAAVFALFLLWGGLSFAWYEPTAPGIQNLLVVAAFALLIVAVSDRTFFTPDLAWYAGRVLCSWTAVAATVYAISVVLDGPGAGSILSSRAFSLFAINGLAWSIAAWRYRSGRWFWATIVLTALIVVSLSRMATVSALLMFPLAWFSPRNARGWIRTGLIVGLVGGAFYFAAVRFEPLHERFFERGPSRTIRVGSLEVTGTGRASFWPATWESFLESPWIGKGAGSAGRMISKVFPGNDHPHNDYLRILHDYGVVGFLLLFLAFGRLAMTVWRAWVRADAAGSPEAQIHMTAFLGVTGLALGMIANNPFGYIFVMSPLAVLCGNSLGRVTAQWEHQEPGDGPSSSGQGPYPRIPLGIERGSWALAPPSFRERASE
jgi:O-antigen ligase